MLYIIKSIYVKVYSLLFVSPETYLYFHCVFVIEWYETELVKPEVQQDNWERSK